MSGYWRTKGWLTGCKNVFGSGSICLSLEEGTSWKSSRVSGGAGIDRSREDRRPEGGRTNQDRLEDREERLTVIYKSWGVHGIRRRRNPSSALCLEGSVVKNPPANVRDMGLIPGSGRSPGGGNDHPLQYSCLGESHGQRSLAGYSP